MATYLERRRRLWYAVLDVPTAQRKVIGKKRFFQSLGTDSLSVAKIKVLPVIHGWKMLIEEAKSGKTGSAQWKNWIEEGRKAGSPEWEIQEAAFNLAVEMDEDGDKGAFVSYLVGTGQAVLLSEHLQPFLDDIGNKQETQTKEYKAKHIRTFLSEFTYADQVNADTIEHFVETQLSHLSVGSRTNYISSFKMFWRYLGKKKLVPRSLEMFRELALEPSRFALSDFERKRKHFEPKDYHKILGAIRLKNKKDTSLYHVIQLGAYTGCRIEELCSLKVEDVHLPEGYLQIRDAKTDAGNRKVPIHSAISELVTELVATTEDGFLLSGLKTNKYDNRSPTLKVMFSTLKTSLGYGPDYVFHSFRKGVATQLEDKEVPIIYAARLLGHKLKDMSYGTYSGGASVETLRRMIELVDWE
jgi:integrase